MTYRNFPTAREAKRILDCADLIAACDEALNWADANARWFDISTAPKEVGDEFLAINCDDMASLNHIYRDDEGYMIWAQARLLDLEGCFTHWAPLPPPPSNPPLPAPLERLGEVLRRVKNV